jgi:ferritin-like metal-binding protein YciE
MELDTLRDLFVHELKDMASAERQILRALPKIIRNAGEPALAAALEAHRAETENQVGRLEQILISLDESTRTNKKCKGMEGILEEGASMLEEKKEIDPEVLDAGIIASCQKVEHYEIAVYGTLATYAKTLGNTEALQLLLASLDEEKAADEKLTKIAKSCVNVEAVA